MEHAHFRNGFLFVIRKKTKRESDAAFIKIKLTQDLEDLRSRSLQLDNNKSPFLVHRQPERIYRELADSKPTGPTSGPTTSRRPSRRRVRRRDATRT